MESYEEYAVQEMEDRLPECSECGCTDCKHYEDADRPTDHEDNKFNY